MKLEDYPTPLTDAVANKHGITVGCMTRYENELEPHARDIERKLRQAEDALAEQFHGKYGVLYQADIAARLSDELSESNRKLTAIYNLVEGDADGTVDSTPYEKLCNEIVGIIKP